MNREIKFRGKGIADNEWYYGDLIQVESGRVHYFIIQDYEIKEDRIELNTCASPEVNPDTIGQYTGLHDKNGKEIYEGDILKSVQWNNIYLVKYIGTAFYLCRKGNNGFNKITTWNNAEKSEIIGNITDNPELLGGE